MAEGGGASPDDRTEAATPRRLEEARGRGDFPVSREPAQALALLAVLAWSALLLPGGAAEVAAAGAAILAAAGEAGGGDPAGALRAAVGRAAVAAGALLAPLAALLLLAAPLAAAAQRAVAFAPEKLLPDGARLDPFAGARRLLAPPALVEFAKGALKVAAALGLVLWLLRGELGAVLGAGSDAPAGALAVLAELARRTLAGIAGFAALAAAVDLVWQHLSWRRRLRMTRQELKDEAKSSEGHPEVRGRLRRLQRERSSRRMLLDVPRAAAVVTNPTHVAVALGYDREREPVPRVLAKGRGALALRIREAAAAAGVAVVEDPPTARALEAAVEVGEVIRPEHYRAVAEVIGFVLARRGGGSRGGDRGGAAT